MKIWQKDKDSLPIIEQFTVGNDTVFDLKMAAYDVLGSMAHTKMLNQIKIISDSELLLLHKELKIIYNQILAQQFLIEPGVEDIHSQVELILTKKLGELGKKIHAGRSRNDQVLVDIKLFLRHEIETVTQSMATLFQVLQKLSDTYKNDLLPGYTHLQLAMPSSFGLWFGAYAESLVDDMIAVKAAFDLVNKNPLGSAAGYGSSFPLNRQYTTELLGFADLNYNVVYAQMSRGKTEKAVAQALSNIADTLSKMSMDVCLFLNQNFNFISFPEELTTGSSIMPHKKNPDVFELIRAHCNRIKGLPNEISLLTSNLPSGYQRDLQLLKSSLFPAIDTINTCLEISVFMLDKITVKKNILDDPKYQYLFTVEKVNQLVLQGTPFRTAYQIVGKEVNDGSFNFKDQIHHTHIGSIGNLCNKEINNNFERLLQSFQFKKLQTTLDALIS
ncbi:MAG: argininosuccinate lyase [Phycisphaerales bacterium]|nr:argininosuccinate lyase [Phycisphaerales bacterium]